MARQPSERQLQDDLAGSLRPAGIPFGLFETFEVAADVYEDAGEFWPYGPQRQPHALTRCHDVVLQLDACAGSGTPLPAARGQGIP